MSPNTEFSNEENEAIEKLRRRMKDYVKIEMYEDKMMFYRFLKARGFNVESAETMLKKHFEWRKKNGIDTILTDYKPDEITEEFLPVNFIGFDKDGCTVRYIPFGTIDMNGLYMSVKFEDIQRKYFYNLEKDISLLEQQSKKLARRVDKWLYIQNLEHLSFAQATNRKCIEDLMSYLRAYQDNYPERLKGVIIINASLYFSIAFSIIKACLGQSILDKVQIFGTDGWKDEILKHIDAEDLPAFLGGRKTDPDGDPMCKTFVNHGGKVPEKYYKHKSVRPLVDAPGVKRVVLSRATFYEETILVDEPESFLEWEFETKVRDIGFGLFFQEKGSEDEKMVEIIPIQRIDTEEYAETGMLKCEKVGKYIIVFDNTYSWLRSKEIYFKVLVMSKDDEKIFKE